MEPTAKDHLSFDQMLRRRRLTDATICMNKIKFDDVADFFGLSTGPELPENPDRNCSVEVEVKRQWAGLVAQTLL